MQHTDHLTSIAHDQCLMQGEHINAAAIATAAAPVIADGDTVEIEGEFFRFRVIGERYSDPAAFVRIAQP